MERCPGLNVRSECAEARTVHPTRPALGDPEPLRQHAHGAAATVRGQKFPSGATWALAPGQIEVGDVLGPKVLWNEPGTTVIHDVTEVVTRTDQTFDLGEEASLNAAAARFSPDGQWIAVPKGQRVQVINVRSGSGRPAGAQPAPHADFGSGQGLQ